MADSTTNLDTVAASQAAKDVTVDELFDAASPALTFGRHASLCGGLTWGYYGGQFNISGTPTAVLGGTLTLDPSSTCYVRVENTTGVVDFVTSAPSGWPAPTGYTALYEIDTGTDAPSDWTDLRSWNPGGTGTGGGGSPTGSAGGDLTGTYPNPTIANSAVTNAKLANAAAHTFKGNNTGSSAAPIDMTVTQATAELNAVVGDLGSGGTKGLVPAPAAGDAAAGKFLKADGTFAVPPGTGSGVTSVALSLPAELTVGGSPVTSSGTLSAVWASETAHFVFAAPVGGGTPSFRALVGSDLPNPSASTLGGIQSIAAVTSKWINSISTSGVPSLTQPAESDISFTDITTSNVSTTKHGYAPKAPNDATVFLNGQGAYTAPSASAGGAMSLINKVVTTGTAATITFSAIPGTFTDLLLIVNGRCTLTGAQLAMRLQINGDNNSTNYSPETFLNGSGSSASSSTDASTSDGCFIANIPGNGDTTNGVGTSQITIANYAGTVFKKMVMATNASFSSTTQITVRAFLWKSSSAITSLVLTPGTAFVDGSTATLYGIG